MAIFLVGASSSKLYNNTTPVKLAELAKFTFSKGLSNIQPTRDDVLIRYGVSSYSDKDYMFGSVLNYGNVIKLSSNKLNCNLLFLQKKIPSPEVFLNFNDIRNEDLPVLRRLKYHSRGSDIKRIDNLSSVVHGDYYSKFIDSKCEYRILVFDGKAIRVQLKVKSEDNQGSDYIHNYENGFLLKDNFAHDVELENKLIAMSERAVATVGLDFGAVDILVSKDNEPYVLEVNSAPRLNKYGRQLFTIYLYRKLGREVNLNDFSRIKVNEGRNSTGLPVEFREIIINR